MREPPQSKCWRARQPLGPFLTLTGQQLHLRWPLPKAEFDGVGSDDAKLKLLVAEFVRQGGEMSHEQGELRLRFGRTDSPREVVTLPMTSDKRYRANASAHLRDTYGFAKDFDPKKDAQEFLRAKK